MKDGCGGPCNYTFCASNPGLARYTMTPNEKAALAINLSARYNQALFSQLASPVTSVKANETFLDLASLKTAIEKCREENTNVPLVRLLGNVFRSSAGLSISFLLHPVKASLTGQDLGLSLDDIRSAYQLILEMPENVSNALHSAIESMALQLQRDAPSLFHPHALRQFVVLLEYPQISDPMSYRRLLGPLLVALQNLPASTQPYLDAYFDTWSDTRLVDWNVTLQNMIALNAMEAGEDENDSWDPHRDAFTVAAAASIGRIHRLNEKRHFLGFQDFYSQFVNERLDISEDFTRYYFPERGYGFCYISSCPFVLNPETKSVLLQVESSVTQRITAHEHVMQNILLGGGINPYLVLRIRRPELIRSSLTALQVPSEDLKKQLKIQFMGEEGIDEGGVKKEWFQLLVKELFDEKYGMFTSDQKNRLQWFSPASTDFSEFELLGKVIGLAVYNGVILDMHFPSVVYKKLMGTKGTFEDLEQIDPDLSRGLKQLLEYDEVSAGESVEEAFMLNFRATYEVYGSLESQDLIENGGDTPVTATNRQEYVRLYTEFKLNGSIERQFDHFKRGFSRVCDSGIFRLFLPEELELLVCGSPILDFEQLEESTQYEGYDKEDITVRNFWTVIHELPMDQKKRFLFFATGTDRAPIGGLAKINLVIQKHGETNSLPTAHTCFSVVILPPTPDLDKMRRSMRIVLENAEGFGMI